MILQSWIYFLINSLIGFQLFLTVLTESFERVQLL